MKLFPSILSADFSCLSRQLDSLSVVVDQFHLDVMDGHFVPNISFGPPVIQPIMKSYSELNWDAHLMISNPEKYFDEFLSLGVNWISVHVETDPDMDYLTREALKNDVRLGLAFNPATDVSEISSYYESVDYILAMTVQPGFSGQVFRKDVLPKIKRVAKQFDGPIQVDGGVGEETIQLAADAGANWFVSGSSVFGTEDPGNSANHLIDAASGSLS